MSHYLQKGRKRNKVMSFMLLLIMVVSMLPSLSMPKIYAASSPTVTIKDFAKTDDSYAITDISIDDFTYGNFASILLTTANKSDVIHVTTNSDVNTAKSHYSDGEYYIEFNTKKTATQLEAFIKSNISITPSFGTDDSHTVTITVTDVYGSGIAAINLTNDTTIGTTQLKPYKVFTADDLMNIGDKKYSVLMNDISLPATWTYINLNSGCIFDGQGYTINMGTISYAIFREVQGTVKNLNVNGAIGGATVRGIVATWSSGGTFDHITASGSLSTKSDYAAGIVGYTTGSGLTTIKNCVNNASITTTTNNAGGICGAVAGSSSVKFENCVNNGAISGSTYIGGIIGATRSSADQILNCYNYGTVNGSGIAGRQSCIAGIAGYSTCKITSCYNSGAVKGLRCVAGISGIANPSTIYDCHNTGTITATGYKASDESGKNYYSGGIVGYLTSGTTIKNTTARQTLSPSSSSNYGGSGSVGIYYGVNVGSVLTSCSNTAVSMTKAQAASAIGVTLSGDKFTYSFASPKVGIAYMDYNGENATNKNAVFVADNYVAPNTSVTLASTASSPTGGVFIGWSTTPSSDTVSYAPSQSITLTDNLTLYPVYRTKDDVTSSFTINKMAWMMSEKQNFTSEDLNNIITGKSSDAIAQKVSGENPTTALKVILFNESDTVTLYKLADISWDAANSIYVNLAWDTKVSKWLSDSEYSASDIVTNPILVSDMPTNLQSEFFNAMLSKDGGVLSDIEPAYINDDADVNGVFEDGLYYTRFNSIPTGMYAVISEESYSPVVISIFPYRNGPGVDWYLDSEYIARLKHSAATVDKKINENDIASTVAYKDTVTFDIDFKFPSLYTDRVTLTGNGTDTSLDYKLYAVDTMSPAFALINTTDNKPIVTYSINGGEATALPATVDYYEFADQTYTGPGTKNLINEENFDTYLYNDNYLLENFGGTELYAIAKSAPIYTLGEPEIAADGTTTLNIIFNAHALKAFAKANSINMSQFVLTLHYEATATDKLEIASDNNTNKVVLHYEETPTKMAKLEDIVYGYTYGLQVIKIDGSSSTEELKKYLADVKFKLYKEVETKPEDMTDVYTYDDNGVDRYFVAVTNIFTEDTTKLSADGVFKSIQDENGIILKGLKEGNYILSETDPLFGYNALAEDIYFEINKLDKEDAENHYSGRYKVFKEKDFVSHESTYNETGMVSLSVINYRGFTLPSTGGIGTLLFTIIGIIIMIAVMLVLVVKKRAKIESYYE